MRVVHLFFEYPHPYQPYNVKLIQTQRDAGIDAVPVALAEKRWYSKVNCKWLELLLVRLDMLLYFIRGGLKCAHKAKRGGAFGWKKALSLSYKYRNIVRLRPDIIHVHHYAIANRAFNEFFHALGVSWCVSIRGRDVTIVPLVSSKDCQGVVYALNNARRVHSVSNSLKKNAERLGVAGEKIQVIYRSFESDLNFQKTSWELHSPISILFLARFNWVKGLVFLLLASKELRKRRVNLTLHICGNGSQEDTEEVHYAVHSLGIQETVRFHGYVRDVQLLAILPGIDFFVQPSLNEGIPNSLIKIMHTGIPVISTIAGGIPELIQNGENGILVPPWDHLALADAIEELIHDENKRKIIANNAMSTVWQTPEKEGREYFEFYQSMMD